MQPKIELLEVVRPQADLSQVLEVERLLDDLSQVYAVEDASKPMCACPVCRSKQIHTLADLAQTPDAADEDGFVIPDVQIGATGIVMPGRDQLARWFKVPEVPKFRPSKFHKKAKTEGKQHGVFAFFSMFSFETVFFTPCPSTMLIALATAFVAAHRTFKLLKTAAQTEDKAIHLELTVRTRAQSARSTAWDKLYYCGGCGMVHDREGKRSLPWYSMLQLVHYPEQEFETIATEAPSTIVIPSVHADVRTARVA